MRLAYCVRAIYPQHGYGGLERSATSLFRHLLRRGVDIALFTRALPEHVQIDDRRWTTDYRPGASGMEKHLPATPLSSIAPRPSSSLAGRLTVHPIRYGRLPLPPNGIPARLTNYRAFVEEMGRRVRGLAYGGHISGIYAHGLCAWGVRGAAEWGVPMLANPHGLEEFKVRHPLKRLAYAPFRAWVRAGCLAADRVVATDHAMRGEVAKLLGLGEQRVVVLPNGVDEQDLRALVSVDVQNNLKVRFPLLAQSEPGSLGISVGRLEANKGFDHLLRGLKIAGETGAPWRWVFVGEGSLRASLEGLAGELGLRNRVIFMGSLSDAELHSLYPLCDLFAHPTLYEGSSLVTLEAMVHALPVVASAVGGIPDKVIEGKTGFLVPPGNEQLIADKLKWMWLHPNERIEMGKQGAHLAAEKFTWERVAAMTEDLFRMLRSGCG